ncbi:MAG: cyclic nucleotide-binding domain-containing protein [Myxococcales bacterium]|nr:cyclic nucleotide-binding domain-containing protein [Myxococcales bacterium]
MKTTLKNSRIFQNLPDDQLDSLLAAGNEVRLAAGSSLATKGDPADTAYILLSGRIVEQWPDGLVTHDEPGALLLPTVLLSDQPNEHDWSVDEDSVVFSLTRAEFKRAFEAQNRAAYAILDEVTQLLVAQLRDLNRVFNELAQGRV